MLVTTFDIRALDELFGPARATNLEALTARLHALDRELWLHARLVNELSKRIAEALALGESQLRALHAAAWLHDIGKLTIARSILDKPGPLDRQEWNEVRQHPARAADFLTDSPETRSSASIVLHHHERFDGGGYPNGLAAEQIPFGARILCVADAFDAMTTARSYRTAMSIAEAIDEVNRCSRSQFDPDVVEALNAIAPELPMELAP